MALIAGRDMYVGRVLVHRKGEPVPGALDWPYPVLKAALDGQDLLDPEGDIARKHDWRQRLYERSAARVAARGETPGGVSEGPQGSELSPAPAQPQPIAANRGAAAGLKLPPGMSQGKPRRRGNPGGR